MTLLLTSVAMFAFAANSLLARAALGGGDIDAFSFTAIRLFSGAVALAALLARRPGATAARPGSWGSALCLFGYALCFSLAYLRLSAATGALILFASVQASMIGWELLRGHRPGALEIGGLAVAFGAFAYLLLPGLRRPDPLGSLLMVAAGLAWGAYSLRGRGSRDPLADTAGNFVRATVIAAPLAALLIAEARVTPLGIVLALISGIVTSGLGYAIWYRALPGLKPLQAASVQLTVPLIAAAGGVAFLSEALTARLALTGALILGGVGLTLVVRR